ncbi:hypothetical protein J2W14_001944 [Pseudarthrobacter oxydans]|nr:hypothetical protein [Pseudarthrobacter oxydans]
MSHATDRHSSGGRHVPPAPSAAPSAGNPSAAGTGVEGMEQILKRETHSSRATASIIAAVLVIALCVYALLETAVRAVGQPPWLVDPQTAAEKVVALPDGVPPLLLGVVGAVLVMAGLFFFLNAVLPGRRARHVLLDRRAAVVVDDEVIASALARRARLAANVSQEQVMVTVSRQQVEVNVRPTSGVPLSRSAVLTAVQDELREMGLTPTPEARINVTSTGVVGA